jgi:PilZ domain
MAAAVLGVGCSTMLRVRARVKNVEAFEDKRRLRRIQISLPIRVRGTNSDGIPFEEMSRSIDVNGDGALFLLKQNLKRGMRLNLSLPLPRSMQKTPASKPVYETEAIVVRIEASDDPGASRVAVRFRSASSKAYYREAS